MVGAQGVTDPGGPLICASIGLVQFVCDHVRTLDFGGHDWPSPTQYVEASNMNIGG